MEIPTVKEMAAFGFTQADYETSKLEEIVAAAKEFERLLNSAPHLIDVDMMKSTFSALGQETRNYYKFQITTIQQVYP